MAYTSLVDYLNSNNQASDLASRASLAVDKGLVKTPQEYMSRAAAGTNGDINTQLLGLLQNPPAPASTTPTTSPSTTPATGGTSTGSVSTSSYNGTTPVVSNNPLTSTQLANAATSPNPTSFVQSNTGNNFADTVSQVAKMNITDANKQAIDTLKSQLEADQAAQKAAEQSKVSNLETGVQSQVGSTTTQDALKTAFDTYKVKENLALYNDIQTKIVEAQKALDLGLVYEADRPARMKFITGAEATLQKQGLATIGALQGTAAVIKGNIDLARSFADATVNAINSDNERSFKALTTLLDLHNGKLINLTADEKATINDRIASIEKEAERLQTNKDAVVGYMTQYPSAFLKGGVTLLDTQQTALQKMLPYLSADEQAKLKADLEYKKSQTNLNNANANKAANDPSGKKDTPQVLQYKDEVAQLFAKNVPISQVIAAYGALVGVDYINQVYGRKGDTNYNDQIINSFQSQFYNQDGSLKPGYKFTGKIDPTSKLPIVEKVSGTDTSSVWGAVKNLWGAVTGK